MIHLSVVLRMFWFGLFVLMCIPTSHIISTSNSFKFIIINIYNVSILKLMYTNHINIAVKLKFFLKIKLNRKKSKVL